MEFSDKVKDALDFSEKAHRGQYYNFESYFDGHIMQVVKCAKEIGLDDDHLCVAALHDILEDTSVEYDQLEKLFGIGVAENVFWLTRKKDSVTYKEYIIEVSKHPYAKNIKLCDLMCNIYNQPEGSLLRRYVWAVQYLATH